MSKCKAGYYYCYTDKKCKPISKGLKMTARFSGGGKEPEEVGIDKPLNGNGNHSNGNGNGSGSSNGGSNGGVSEGSLHKWFKGSKSKDGKGGWVNVVTGGTCASDEPGEGTPKCVSSAKRASMSKAERLSAQRRKKKADPGQQQKSGAAKPTYVSTDKKKMKKEEVEVTEAKDKKGKGSGTKDACYHKVKSRYSVWPSAYASGALVKCRKVGAANWGNKSEGYSDWRAELDEAKKCWKGYEKKGTQKLFGKTYNRCVKKEETEIKEKKDPCWDTHKQVGMKKKNGRMVPNCVPKEESNWRSELGEDWQKVNKKDKTDGMSRDAVKAYRRENPGSKLQTAVTGNPERGSKDAKRKKSYCSRSEGQKDMHNIDCSKTPDKAICKARRRWKC